MSPCIFVDDRSAAYNITRHLIELGHRNIAFHGSSDHAATYLKYLSETRLGLVCASAAPSISLLYHAKQQLAGMPYIAISQAGASPDLLASVERANESGALTLAFVNVEDSPLAKQVDIVVPLRAGKE